MATADEVVVELSATSENYKRSLTQAEGAFKRTVASIKGSVAGLTSSFDNTAKTFLTLFAVKKVYDFVRATIDSSAALVDLADRLKISTTQLQQYQAAANLAHISTDDFNSLIEIFARNTGEASRGQGDLSKVLKANNIAIKDSAGAVRPLNQLFNDYIDLLSRSTDASTTAKLSQIAFGRAAAEIGTLAKGGSSAIKAIGDEALRTGRILSPSLLDSAAKLDQQFIHLEASMAAAFKTMAIAAGPAIIKVITEFTKFIDFYNEHKPEFGILGKTLLGFSVGRKFGGPVGGLIGAAGGFGVGVGTALGDQFNAAIDKALAEPATTPGPTSKLSAAITASKSFAAAKAAGKPDIGTVGVGGKPPIVPPSSIPAPNQFETATRAIKEQTAAVDTERKTLGESTYEVERQKAALALLQAAHQAGIPITKDVIATVGTLSEAYAKQVDELERVRIQQDRVNQAATDAFEAVKTGFADVIFGAKSFEDALAGILHRFAEIALNNVFESIFAPKGPGGAGGPAGGIFNFIGKLLGGGFTGPHAAGGLIPSGMTGTANENETIYATKRGAIIIPTGTARGSRGGGVQNSSNFNITVEASGNEQTDDRLARALEENVRGIMRDEQRSQMKLRGMLNPL